MSRFLRWHCPTIRSYRTPSWPHKTPRRHLASANQHTALHTGFRDQLAQAYGQNNQLVDGLLCEAVKQWGSVQTARAGAQRPQVVATGVGQQIVEVRPVDPEAGGSTASGPGVTAGESQA